MASLTSRVAADGERVDPSGTVFSHTEEDHLARYEFALGLVRGSVLDVACGTGYGTAMLAPHVRDIVGMDADDASVLEARSRAPGIRFEVGVVPPIAAHAETFDSIVSFETIEHIEDDLAFLRELRRVITTDGVMLLSTPNKEITSPNGPPENPWHVREYTLEHLSAVVERAGFRIRSVLAQRGQPPRGPKERLALRVVARLPTLCRPGRWWDTWAHGTARVQHWDGTWAPVYWVLVAEPV